MRTSSNSLDSLASEDYSELHGILLCYVVGNSLPSHMKGEQALLTVGEKVQGILKQDPTFNKLPDVSREEEVFRVEPTLVAELGYCGWTKDRLLRHSSFKGLRKDKTCPPA